MKRMYTGIPRCMSLQYTYISYLFISIIIFLMYSFSIIIKRFGNGHNQRERKLSPLIDNLKGEKNHQIPILNIAGIKS